MKKHFNLALTFGFAALLMVSCSKEQRQSKKLDGNWEINTINGQDPGDDYKETVEFSASKKGIGSGTITYDTPNFSGPVPFTYTVIDERLEVVEPGIILDFAIQKLDETDLELNLGDTLLFTYKRK
jgi:hypothetical protein